MQRTKKPSGALLVASTFHHLLSLFFGNTIENFWDVNDKNILPFIAKFLNHQSNRVRANAIILLFKYKL